MGFSVVISWICLDDLPFFTILALSLSLSLSSGGIPSTFLYVLCCESRTYVSHALWALVRCPPAASPSST
ncbi:uncharacterized protein LACBIDRAFT_316220 [Laccaria bicolor S238N-H82]|uniref:Predicted protein n=1 Tax=Laccaria bicolor (strain S238N-H82 / ATCC MYA-4686) TaxID=486041 RepID=B0DZI3_LACBS|nr:uncharacterized protein LACBIDRAFT_314941 [Laccaria bicolor S238N-H82]XP_001889691.1 uncharacterized protein LACBIDRAFT_316220 [Laccaria bicolor S238N-H82]EDQ99714.1 predicted protein [Laccaria bicolor S238N-H82]EDR00042.1 predicted protein [Laccaria bicolor S238N-H82]|eukprot:XP_001889351.1 predicted protein [Laccaria bicolor S238N-H82]